MESKQQIKLQRQRQSKQRSKQMRYRRGNKERNNSSSLYCEDNLDVYIDTINELASKAEDKYHELYIKEYDELLEQHIYLDDMDEDTQEYMEELLERFVEELGDTLIQLRKICYDGEFMLLDRREEEYIF